MKFYLVMDQQPQRSTRNETYLPHSTYVRSPADNETTQQADREHQRVVTTLLSAVDATPADRSHVLEITVRSQSPLKASRVVNAFADLYIEQQLILKDRKSTRLNSSH